MELSNFDTALKQYSRVYLKQLLYPLFATAEQKAKIDRYVDEMTGDEVARFWESIPNVCGECGRPLDDAD